MPSNRGMNPTANIGRPSGTGKVPEFQQEMWTAEAEGIRDLPAPAKPDDTALGEGEPGWMGAEARERSKAVSAPLRGLATALHTFTIPLAPITQ